MARRKTHYTVWRGRSTGIFNSWEECEKQVKGFRGGLYQGFFSHAEAEQAFENPPDYVQKRLAVKAIKPKQARPTASGQRQRQPLPKAKFPKNLPKRE